MRGLMLGLVALGVFCGFFVEWPAPKFKPGDVVWFGDQLYLYKIQAVHRSDVTLKISGGKVKIIGHVYKASIYHSKEFPLPRRVICSAPESQLTIASKRLSHK